MGLVVKLKYVLRSYNCAILVLDLARLDELD